jgi:hypothetical protein
MNTSTTTRIKCAFALFGLMLVGLGPIPVTSSIGLYIVIFRPKWFKRVVDRVYSE